MASWTRQHARKDLRLRTVVVVLFCLLAVPAITTEQSTGKPPKRKNVLVLFGSDRRDNRQLLDLIETETRPRVQGPITFYETYLTTNLDLKIYKAYQDSQAETFRQTYGWLDLDLIIAVYPQAVDFATQYWDKMFPGVPIMFAGIGIKTGWELKDWPGVPGESFAVGIRETIDLALRLHPDTKRVAVVAGPDWGWIEEIHSELLRRNIEVVDIIMGDPNREVLERVAALPPHTVALLHTTLMPNRSEFGSRELISGISQILPTYSAWEYICLDLGCIGGAYADEQKGAALAADIAARILSGERPDHIPKVHNTDLRATVDWRALHRWRVPESALPPGTLVLYREPTLWERGRKYFIAGIAVILVQTFLILALFWQRARKRRAEAELRRSEEKFSKSFRQSPLVIAITRMSDSRYVDVNRTFEQHLGWSRNEVIGRTPHDLDLWADADERTAFAKELQAKGSVRDLEICLRRKDGETRTLLLSAELIDVGGEPCALSVAADVTERRQAEEVLSTMSRRLIEAQEKERTWIARELHDDISQRFAMVSITLESLQLDLPSSEIRARCRLEETKQQVDDLGDDVQALSHRLHSSKLDILGLEVACRGFCNELSNRQSVEIEFDSDNVPKNLSQEISLCLFRVLQEALQNAVKYSGVRQFRVSLKATPNEVELKVQDSGVGFDLEKAIGGHGLGLTSMKERMKLVDGLLSIDSRLEHGTTIHACVPLSPKTMRSGAGFD